MYRGLGFLCLIGFLSAVGMGCAKSPMNIGVGLADTQNDRELGERVRKVELTYTKSNGERDMFASVGVDGIRGRAPLKLSKETEIHPEEGGMFRVTAFGDGDQLIMDGVKVTHSSDLEENAEITIPLGRDGSSRFGSAEVVALKIQGSLDGSSVVNVDVNQLRESMAAGRCLTLPTVVTDGEYPVIEVGVPSEDIKFQARISQGAGTPVRGPFSFQAVDYGHLRLALLPDVAGVGLLSQPATLNVELFGEDKEGCIILNTIPSMARLKAEMVYPGGVEADAYYEARPGYPYGNGADKRTEVMELTLTNPLLYPVQADIQVKGGDGKGCIVGSTEDNGVSFDGLLNSTWKLSLDHTVIDVPARSTMHLRMWGAVPGCGGSKIYRHRLSGQWTAVLRSRWATDTQGVHTLSGHYKWN